MVQTELPRPWNPPLCTCSVLCRALGSATRGKWPAAVRNAAPSTVELVMLRRFEPGSVLVLERRDPAGDVEATLTVLIRKVEAEGKLRWRHLAIFARELGLEELALFR